MRVTSRTTPRLRTCNIDILGWRKHESIFTYFVVIERELPSAAQESIVNQRRDCNVIAMLIHRPMRKHHIRLLRFQHFPEILIVRVVQNRVTVALSGKGRARPKNRACPLRFGRADRAPRITRSSRAALLAMVQIQQHHVMTQIRIPRHRPAAAILRVARVAAVDYYFEPRQLLRDQRHRRQAEQHVTSSYSHATPFTSKAVGFGFDPFQFALNPIPLTFPPAGIVAL